MWQLKNAFLYLFICLNIISCRSSDSGDTNTSMATTTGTDITGTLFSNQSGDCGQYAGDYQANANDVNNNTSYTSQVSINDGTDNCTLTSNEIPNHDFNDGNGSFLHQISEQAGSYSIPKNSATANQAIQPYLSGTALSLETTNAVFLNGVTLDLLAAACYGEGNEVLGNEKTGCGNDQINHPWRYDPMSPLNDFGTDSHNAHTQPDGTYHYHGNPNAMFDQNCDINAEPSPVIGFAADGYPIFGSCYLDSTTGNVLKATSSYQLKNNGGARVAVNGYQTPDPTQGTVQSANYDGQFTGDWEYVDGSGVLDDCNGMTINGQYGYYITDSYPWVMGCFKGTIDSSFSKTAGMILNSSHSH